jgi:Holliday junction resolvase RusA-like endonuclease
MNDNKRYITAWVDGIPKGQPRPRATMRGRHAGVYDPGTADGWKDCIMLALKSQRPEHPFTGPVQVCIDHYMPRPKGHFGSGKKADMLKDSAPAYHASKPDSDNLAKAALDAITQMGGFWLDDSQVSCLIVKKFYCTYQPCAYISITELNNSKRFTELPF